MRKIHAEQILEKKKRLEEAKQILNNEFIGLSPVIDTIIDSLSSWYLFPEIQEKPIVINLWGLTGVGKSSLVNRLSELLGFEKKYYRFDLGGSSDRSWEVKNKLQDIFENENGFPVIIGLDEFQHAKTKNEKGEEIDSMQSRVVWDLLDSGKFNISRSMNSLDRIYSVTQKLRYALQTGVQVENGLVISKHEKFIDLMDYGWKKYRAGENNEMHYEKDDVYFIDPDHGKDIYALAPEFFENEFEVGAKILTLNGEESIKLLDKVIELGMSPKIVDCSKSLIFIMGNLDEVYSMNSDFNPDINADEFHNRSLKINISNVKEALKERFRSEQIARLGNIHIIYPAFSQSSFLKLIELELDKIKAKYKNSLGINVEFDNSVIDIIYREGVFPTQGTRPLFTTINYLIGSKIGKVYFEINTNNIQADKVLFTCEEQFLVVEFIKDGSNVYSYKEKLDLNLEKLRKNRKDDLQAITAVHEAGHAVISIALMNNLPEYIYSITADTDSHGFTYIRNEMKFVSKKMILNKLALFMGGLAAEKLIFGEENITTGADDDLRRATKFVMDMLKYCGMGSKKGWINVEDGFNNLTLFDTDNTLNKEGEDLLKKAFALSIETLKKEKELLLKLSDHLADNRLIKKEEIRQMVQNYGIVKNKEVTGTENANLFYRKRLKELVSGKAHLEVTEILKPEMGFSLNKDNK